MKGETIRGGPCPVCRLPMSCCNCSEEKKMKSLREEIEEYETYHGKKYNLAIKEGGEHQFWYGQVVSDGQIKTDLDERLSRVKQRIEAGEDPLTVIQEELG